MMKLSMMLFMMEMPLLLESGSFAIGTEPLPEDKIEKIEYLLSCAKEAGFPMVDLTSVTIKRVGTDRIREMLDKYGLKLNCIVCPAPYADPVIPDQAVFEDAKEAIDSAAELGTGMVMLALAPTRSEDDRELLFNTMARRFGQAVEYADSFGITCVIEDDPKINIPLCSKDEVLRMVNTVKGLKIAFDTSNMLMVHEDPAEDYPDMSPYVAHVHLKDVRAVPKETPMADISAKGNFYIGVPHGEGEIDFPAVFSAFHEKRYSGPLAVEVIPAPEKDLLSEFTRIFRYFSDLM